MIQGCQIHTKLKVSFTLALESWRIAGYGVIESYSVVKESCWGLVCGRKSLNGGTERSLDKAVKVKPELCRKSQHTDDAKAMRHPPRRAADRQWNQPRGEKCATGSKAGRAEQSRPLTPDTDRQDLKLSLMGFSLALVQFFSLCPHSSPLKG